MQRLSSIYFILLFLLLVLSSNTVVGGGVLNFPLNGSESTYIKASIRGQFWTRLIHANPGTQYRGREIERAIDLSVRRVRASVQVKPSARTFFYLAFGGNNFNKKVGSDPEIKLLDINAEYQFASQLSIGFGKSGWAGLSRWNVRSSKTMMTLDAPLFYLQTVNINDDLGRAWGGWIKGREGKWEYVIAIRKPKQVPLDDLIQDIRFSSENSHLNYSAYLKYQFLDRESDKTAYIGGCGTYLGRRSIFNLGGGFMYQPEMMEGVTNQNIELQDYIGWNIEAYLDAPWRGREDWNLTGFVGLLNSDFGKGYVRRLGANDYTTGGSTWSGSGTDYPMMGTGSSLFVQIGFLNRNRKFKSINLQPNIAWQHSDFEALAGKVNVWHGGLNWYLDGHNHKVSIGFENRPVFDKLSEEIIVVDRKTNWMIQYQFEFN